MRKRAFISAVLGLLLGFQPLQAQEPAPQAAQQVAGAATTHPFYPEGLYPEWSKMTPDAAREDFQAARELMRARQEAICNTEPGQETYENVFDAMDKSDLELETTHSFLINLAQTNKTNEIARLQEELMPAVADTLVETATNKRLWEVVERAAAQPWAQGLSPEKERLVQQLMDLFRDGGVNQPPEKQEQIKRLLAAMVKLQLKFDKNLDYSASLWRHTVTDIKDLDGMPEAWLEQRGRTRWGKTVWTLTLADVETVLTQCTVEKTRKACWLGWNSTLGNGKAFNNGPVVYRILQARQELAELTGFKNFADLACKQRMVNTGDKALAFVDDMMNRLLPAFQREQQELLDFVSEQTGQKTERIAPWDYKFYQGQLAKRQCDFDEEAVRPYLQIDNVINGMFTLASRLYDITISELPAAENNVDVWHPTVKVYTVTDNKTGEHIGSFYLDMYSRPNKQGGAWTHPLRPALATADGKLERPHLSALVCNIPMPADGSPALLLPRHVETLFHEFGHLLHGTFCRSGINTFSMKNVSPDFAELPSQLNESFAWEPECIALYALHHETKEPIPAGLVQQLRASRNFHAATKTMETLHRAKLDLEMHMHFREKFDGKDLDAVTAEILAPWSFPYTQPESSKARYFSHSISKGYSAAFFSYPWADVMAADVLARFKRDGLINPETGAAYRTKVLEHGNSRPANQLYRDFMGRDPNPDALLERQGISLP